VRGTLFFKARPASRSPTFFKGGRPPQFLVRDVIYTSRAYATMPLSVCLSVTEVHRRIIATCNSGFKFRSNFTAHCGRGEGSSQQQQISRYASHCWALLFIIALPKLYQKLLSLEYISNVVKKPTWIKVQHRKST